MEEIPEEVFVKELKSMNLGIHKSGKDKYERPYYALRLTKSFKTFLLAELSKRKLRKYATIVHNGEYWQIVINSKDATLLFDHTGGDYINEFVAGKNNADEIADILEAWVLAEAEGNSKDYRRELKEKCYNQLRAIKHPAKEEQLSPEERANVENEKVKKRMTEMNDDELDSIFDNL